MKKIEVQNIPLSKLHLNRGQIKDVPKNPRFIKDERFAALKKSIEDDPEMLNLRELVAYDNDGELVVILGNMRYRAMKELGYKEAPVKVLPTGTEAKKLRAYIQKDNIAFGQNDWDLLGNEWDVAELEDFGLEVDFLNDAVDVTTEDNQTKEEDNNYSREVQVPIYEIVGEEPPVSELVDISPVEKLLKEINEAKNISEEQKKILRICAYRHAVINFEKMAEYYPHQTGVMQQLMENSALVIVDYKKAIELGFMTFTEKMKELLPSENECEYDEE